MYIYCHVEGSFIPPGLWLASPLTTSHIIYKGKSNYINNFDALLRSACNSQFLCSLCLQMLWYKKNNQESCNSSSTLWCI